MIKKVLHILLIGLLLLYSSPLLALPTKTLSADGVKSTKEEVQSDANQQNLSVPIDTHSVAYVEHLGYHSLSDPALLRYVKDVLYMDLVKQLNGTDYFVENIDAVWVSKEYLEELAYNSQENIYFGYNLSDLNKIFQGQKYIFTLGKNGETAVEKFEEYNDEIYRQVFRNVAIGGGVILLCVTVSVVTGGMGTAPAITVIFAASAKSAALGAVSAGALSAVAAGMVEGIQTHDFNKAVRAAALVGSEKFKWGAFGGALAGGAAKALELKGLAASGLTLNDAARIQQESFLRPEFIKNLNNMEQYKKIKELGLMPRIVDGKLALVKDIDLQYIAPGEKLTNLQRMLQGKAPISPITGKAYELHHLGQHNDAPLAMLTKAEHMQNGMKQFWHKKGGPSEIARDAFDKVRMAFWKDYAQQYIQGVKL